MFYFGKSEVEELRKEHETKELHRKEIEALKDNYRAAVERMKDEKRSEHQSLKDEIAELTATLERRGNENSNLATQLDYERLNRQTLIDAAVQKELGQYETRYYHDLHTFIENHSDKTQDRMMKYMENTLQAIKELKPTEPKVMILGKEVFGADAKANQSEKKQN